MDDTYRTLMDYGDVMDMGITHLQFLAPENVGKTPFPCHLENHFPHSCHGLGCISYVQRHRQSIAKVKLLGYATGVLLYCIMICKSLISVACSFRFKPWMMIHRFEDQLENPKINGCLKLSELYCLGNRSHIYPITDALGGITRHFKLQSVRD